MIREDRNAQRRRRLRRRRGSKTRTQMEYARAQREIDRQLSGWTLRRILCWTLFCLAAAIAVQHWLAHLAWKPLPFSMGWQDLLVGYPTASLLALVGAILLGSRTTRR